VQAAIAAVRGTTYTVKPSVGLYPTSATSDDHSFSRHFVDASKGKVRGFTLETGTTFQPPYSEAQEIIAEVSAGLVEFCLASICAVDALAALADAVVDRAHLRAFRDSELVVSPAGRRIIALVEGPLVGLLPMVVADNQLHRRAVQVLNQVSRLISTYQQDPSVTIPSELGAEMCALADALEARAEASLQPALTEVRQLVNRHTGKTVAELTTAD
jgi:hypothetical protein